MTKDEFLQICERVEHGEKVCVKHSSGQQGEIKGCLKGGESFSVEVKVTGAQEVWHRTQVEEVPC